MSDASATPGFRITGWHVLAIVTGFFAVVIGVDVTFAVLAYRTYPGEVSVTPYEDGILYNRTIAQLDRQAKLGWQAAAAAEPGAVTLIVRDKADRPVQGLKVVGKLERPATETGRLTPRFAETAPGRYEGKLGHMAGTWDFSAEAHDGQGRVFVAERRLTWP